MISRLMKIVLSLIGIWLVGAMIVGYLLITPSDPVSAASTRLDDLPLNTWTRIDLSDKAQCSDGSAYYISARRSESDNLLIHFAGGGMSLLRVVLNGSGTLEEAKQRITLNEFAAWSDELPHEFLVGLGQRLPRVYK